MFYSDVGADNRDFKVLIYASEHHRIQAWVDRFQNLETGGDLFGLWSDQHTAVVQLVLGPGKRCQRTSVSFYQDINYLERVGNHLTGKEGLCHIGEWHSHHRLGLARPSGGDENTVWSNMPKYGIKRFLLFIANIESSYFERRYTKKHVKVSSFLFEFDGITQHPVKQGSLECLSNESPFRSYVPIKEKLEYGAESLISEKELEVYKANENKGKPTGNKRHGVNGDASQSVKGKRPKKESSDTLEGCFTTEKASQTRQSDSKDTSTEKQSDLQCGSNAPVNSTDALNDKILETTQMNTDENEEEKVDDSKVCSKGDIQEEAADVDGENAAEKVRSDHRNNKGGKSSSANKTVYESPVEERVSKNLSALTEAKKEESTSKEKEQIQVQHKQGKKIATFGYLGESADKFSEKPKDTATAKDEECHQRANNIKDKKKKKKKKKKIRNEKPLTKSQETTPTTGDKESDDESETVTPTCIWPACCGRTRRKKH